MHLGEGDEGVHDAGEDPLLQQPQHDLRADQDLEDAPDEETTILKGKGFVIWSLIQ